MPSKLRDEIDFAGLDHAVQTLIAGELVGMPTETVYGLAADATNPAAIKKIFARKGRPADHPLIVHLAADATLDEWAVDIPESARQLCRAFWPGPLTLILKKSQRVDSLVTGGQDSVGLRCPAHPVAQALLAAFSAAGSGALAAPSANRFGHVSPTTAQHVRDEFGSDLLVLEGGMCKVGIESTILDLSRGHPVLLRPGSITPEQIATVMGLMPQVSDSNAPRASGMLAAHYAPRALLRLVPTKIFAEAIATAKQEGRRVAVLAVGVPADPQRYAHDLYAELRRLDEEQPDVILVEQPPQTAEWEGVNDRLKRAAHRKN